MITDEDGYFLFVLNGQQNERVILKFTGKASEGTVGTTHKNPWKKHHLLM